MVDKNAISRVYKEQEGFQSQLFVVPRKDGGQRPIINLKKLNSFVQTQQFKMKGIHMLKDLLKPGGWMTKFDLKDAYCNDSNNSDHPMIRTPPFSRKSY